MYKIIAKILTARLKMVVDCLVGPSRSAFIEGRNILDNVILAHELIKGYTQKAVSPRCMIKVAIRKAYDSVEWSFLSYLMMELEIPYKMMCCRADKVSINLMMKQFEHFSAASGLQANMEKSSLYVAGVSTQYKDEILKELHFTTGALPFKYLRVLLSSKKLTVS
ncbi:uncharacterized protein [Nicotiana sylvestris]|uniref:Reverse transcriptase domain-containing protein n=2 Tax=Nicotiana TaxID=4085 RepID=A0A1S4C6P1_TOBAC|nr:PREDICTED: uncharacterized protein LOC104222588 [Nicotiana sylvestris]XP_016496793.1 PREDICTED: uncharacterized protein LOC107815687 [Nicotiana tabacum]